MRLLYTLLFLSALPFNVLAQEMTAEEVLDRAIAYHDPNGNWGRLQEVLSIDMTYADGRVRTSKIAVNMPKNYFKLTATTDNTTIEQELTGDDCVLKLNGSTEISEEAIKANRLTCERANTLKNYYLYLYGLPMKLKDQGTQLDPLVRTKRFKGKEYKVLKVTYDSEVGDDTWYFYFDPTTFAMEVYQFYHEESKNDGEYILLSDLETVGDIKMPKVRAWYYNKDDQHLGTDVLVKSTPLEE